MRSPQILVFLVKFVANLFIVGGIALLGYTYTPVVSAELWFRLKDIKKQEYSLHAKDGQKESVFARYLSTKPVLVVPVSTSFGIVIEKIGVNAPIVKNVSVVDEDAYKEALRSGVAHATGSALPGERGNIYFFAHSSLNFFQLGKYSTTFNLLRKLEAGDPVHVFYEGKDFEYKVVGKEVVKGWDTTSLTKTVLGPTLTLQTCDPPGTTFNRLVVTAELSRVN